MLSIAAIMLFPYPHPPESELTRVEATAVRGYWRGRRSKSLWLELKRDDVAMNVTCHALVRRYLKNVKAEDDVACLLDGNSVVALTVNGETVFTYSQFKRMWDTDTRFWGIVILIITGVVWLLQQPTQSVRRR